MPSAFYPQFNGGVRKHHLHATEFYATPSHQVHVCVRAPFKKHAAPHWWQYGAESQVSGSWTSALPEADARNSKIFQLLMTAYVAAPPHAIRPPLHLCTVLAPLRRIVSPAAHPAAALFMELSSETAAVLRTTAPRRPPHYPTTRGLSHSNAEGRPRE